MARPQSFVLEVKNLQPGQESVLLDLLRREGFTVSVPEPSQGILLLTNNLKEAVLAYDMERRLIYVNPAIEPLTGYSVEELKREQFICWVHPEDRSRMLAYWDKLFGGGSYDDVEYRMVTKGGEVKWVEASWGPLRDETGAQVGVQGCEREITARKHAEQERTRLTGQLQQAQKLESVGRLAGGVAHDFNNLLTVINGYSDLALEQMAPGDPLRTPIEEISAAGARAAGLVRQLLAVGRRQVLDREVLNVNEVISGLQKTLLRLTGERIKLVTALSPSLDAVLADRHQMEQVLVNLAVNARDAMPEGGGLTISTGNDSLSGVCQHCGCDVLRGAYVHLTVADTGTGMDEDVRRRIFEPFFSTKEVGKGTGLGLATVYGIVAQSAGHVCVASQPGRGTVFHVFLPSSEATTLPQTKILLVDDDKAVRQLLRAVLESDGYAVEEAEDGAQALEAARATEPALVITDLVMPGREGAETIRELRRLHPSLRIIATSGAADGQYLLTARALGAATVLEKPIAPDALLKEVKTVLGVRG